MQLPLDRVEGEHRGREGGGESSAGKTFGEGRYGDGHEGQRLSCKGMGLSSTGELRMVGEG